MPARPARRRRARSCSGGAETVVRDRFRAADAEGLRNAVAAVVARQPLHPGKALGFGGRIAEVEDGGAVRHILNPGVEAAAQAVPEIVRDAVVAGLAMEVVCEVQPLDAPQEGRL